MQKNHFCVCKDEACPLHPINHDKGCDLCIQKNLKKGEIPSCFFRAIKDDLTDIEDFTYEGFVKFFMQNKQSADKEDNGGTR